MTTFTTITDLIRHGTTCDVFLSSDYDSAALWTITALETQADERSVTLTERAVGRTYVSVGTGELGFTAQRLYRPRLRGIEIIERTFTARPLSPDDKSGAYRLTSTPQITHHSVAPITAQVNCLDLLNRSQTPQPQGTA